MVARHLRPSERLTAISSRTHLKETKYASILSILSFHLSWFYPLNGGQSRVIAGLACKCRPRPRNQRARLTLINCAQTIMSVKINEADARVLARAHPGA